MNLPNKLSLLRICLIPLFVVAFFLPYTWGAIVSCAIFILAALTDFLDGYRARKYNLVTDLGKLLDPIADKMLVCAALFCLAATNPLQYCFENVQFWTDFGYVFFAVTGMVILARELLISAVRMIAATKGVVLQANMYGKVKTVFQVVSLPCLLLLYCVRFVATFSSFWTILACVAIALYSIAVLMTILSGIVYLVQNKYVFKQETETDK